MLKDIKKFVQTYVSPESFLLDEPFYWRHIVISDPSGFSTYQSALEWLKKELERIMVQKVYKVVWRVLEIEKILSFGDSHFKYVPRARFSLAEATVSVVTDGAKEGE